MSIEQFPHIPEVKTIKPRLAAERPRIEKTWLRFSWLTNSSKIPSRKILKSKAWPLKLFASGKVKNNIMNLV